MQDRIINVGTATVFGILIIYSIFIGHLIAAGTYFLYAAIWAFLTYLTVEGGLNALPTREAFLNSLTLLPSPELLPDEKECSICYDLCKPGVKLPCGHVFCASCVARIFSAESNDYRCPFCRRALFRMAAPWDTAVVKLFVCTAVLRFVESIIIASYVVYYLDLENWHLSWWYLLDVPTFVWNFYNDVQTLKTLWECLDHNGLILWEQFEGRRWWALVPFQLWRLGKFPWSIQARMMKLVAV